MLIAGSNDEAARALAAVQDEVAAIDAACSRFRPDSELSQLNAAGGRPFAAGPLLWEALAVVLRAARLTGGLVDPTIGRALRELGYDRDFAALALAPTTAAPAVVITHRAPGWRSIRLDPRRRTVTVPAGVEVDLGATAKALAADRAAHAAARAAGCGVLVSLGGDIATAGAVPSAGWTVRVADDHAAPADAPGQTVTLHGGALATSGTTVRRWYQAASARHHLIDPATGQPAAEVWRTVSVTAATCVDANTASTAAIILGAAAPSWLAARSLPARLVSVDGAVTTVAGWPPSADDREAPAMTAVGPPPAATLGPAR